MMIFLFSGSRAVFIACEALTALFMMTRIYDGGTAPSSALILLIGSVISVIAANTYAGLLHHRALLVLYSMLNPEDFIKIYAPLIGCKWIPANVRFTLTAYLSNGYAAKGDFARAKELLDRAPAAGKRQALACDLILCGNRASIALAEGNADEAEAQLKRMAQRMKTAPLPAKKRAAQEDILKTQRAQLHILRGACTLADCDVLRAESKKPGSALRRVELNCFIGRAYALLGENALAREYLTPAAGCKTVVWGKAAAEALRSLPSNAQPGSKKK